jgi:histone H3/H4
MSTNTTSKSSTAAMTATTTAGKKRKSNTQPSAATTLPQLPPARLNESATDAFARAIMKKSLANLCVSMGFGTADGAAFNALSQVARHKIVSLGQELKSVAENSTRKQVTFEDFAQCVSKTMHAQSSSREPLRYLVGIPKFPVESTTNSSNSNTMIFSAVGDMNGAEAPTNALNGLSHLPPFPPLHTYKRTKLEAPDLPASTVADLRRIHQRNSALVRESLAKMRPRSENPVSRNGESSNLARLMEGDFES